MLLLQFLEVCIGGAFDLLPAYVHEILLVNHPHRRISVLWPPSFMDKTSR